MAVDKLVDSGKLDACCEAEAAAIIAKGGGTAPLAYDFANNKGFADAIAAIPSGGGGGFTAEGDIEVVDNLAGSVTLPVNCTTSFVYVLLYATETGTVVDGVKTADAVLTAHSSKRCIYTCAGINRDNPNVGVSASYGTYAQDAKCFIYCAASTTSGMTPETHNTHQISVLSNGTIRVSSPYSSVYPFCDVGMYTKFHYMVWGA